MNRNKWVRQAHRWLSIAFTVAVIVNLVALARESQAVWVGVMALVPLGMLVFTGLYLFALPYVPSSTATGGRSRRRHRPGGDS